MSYILFTPQEVAEEVKLPFQVWRHLARMLRSYNLPVYLLAARGFRADYATFAENDILCDLSEPEKVRWIDGASLVVGTPNPYVAQAAKLNKKLVILYPAGIDQSKYFPWSGANFFRVIYNPKNVQIEWILTGVRTLVERMSSL